MININLVPEVKKQQKKLQQTNLTVTIVSVMVLAVILLTLLVFLGIRISKITSSKNLSKNITKTEKELENYKKLEETVVSLQKGLKGMNEISKNSREWSLFFSELEKATPGDVAFLSINVKENTVMADLQGKDIDSLARFVESFNRYKIKNGAPFVNLDVSGYTKNESGGVNFSAKFDLVKEVLWP